MIGNQKQVNKKGYSLIEVMVAVTIFSIVIAAPTGFLVGSLKAQQKALASQKLLANTSHSLEYISRALRMSRKELSTILTNACLVQDSTILYGHNYQITREGNGLRFINYKGECQEFFWDLSDNRLKEVKDGTEPVPLSAEDSEIISLKFNLIGETQADDFQPRVTLFLDIKGAKDKKSELQPEIKIQTTVSQRNLDVAY